MTFAGSLAALLSEVAGFALEEPVGFRRGLGRFARSREGLAKAWLASVCGLGVIPKLGLMEVGSSRLI